MTEKKYLIVEVCNPKCPFMTDEIDNFCLLEKEEEMVLCKFENCPHGKTLDEMSEIVASDDNFCNDIEYGKKEAATSAVKALIGGEEK